jgi:hypothetical protein
MLEPVAAPHFGLLVPPPPADAITRTLGDTTTFSFIPAAQLAVGAAVTC